MADTQGFLAAFLEQLAAFGVSAGRARLRERDGGEWKAFGSSSLDVYARPWPAGAGADATDGARWPFMFGAASSGGTRNVVHRTLRRPAVHADHYQWTSRDGGEQTFDLHATVEWQGAWYGLRVFSNSCDFRKDLGGDLPHDFSWDRFMQGFSRLADAPTLDAWTLDTSFADTPAKTTTKTSAKKTTAKKTTKKTAAKKSAAKKSAKKTATKKSAKKTTAKKATKKTTAKKTPKTRRS